MPAQQEAVSKLWWNWNSGEGIKNQMDSNLRKIGALMQTRVLSRSLTTPPGSPVDGSCYIVPNGTTTWPAPGLAGDVAVWRAYLPGWEYYEPGDGHIATVIEEGTYGTLVVFKSGSWSADWGGGSGGGGGGGGGGTVPSPVVQITGTTYDVLDFDVLKYLYFTNTAAKTVTVRPNATHTLPTDYEVNIRNAAASNLTITPGSEVTIAAPYGGTMVVPPHGTVTLKRVAVNSFHLIGVTVPA